jgi:hypothetical protein
VTGGYGSQVHHPNAGQTIPGGATVLDRTIPGGRATTGRPPTTLAERVDRANDLTRQAAKLLGFDTPAHTQPVAAVQWVHLDRIQANDYNPNSVPHQEMKLLHTSIEADGYTQPIVCVYDSMIDKYVIVDGFHRWTVLRRYPDIAARTHGYAPVVVLTSGPADRMASTVRHNRARGKHSVAGMGHLVFEMLTAGESDAQICNKLGLEAEELARLKHITGYSKLYADAQFTAVTMTGEQLAHRATYHADHPDEPMPEF